MKSKTFNNINQMVLKFIVADKLEAITRNSKMKSLNAIKIDWNFINALWKKKGEQDDTEIAWTETTIIITYLCNERRYPNWFRWNRFVHEIRWKQRTKANRNKYEVKNEEVIDARNEHGPNERWLSIQSLHQKHSNWMNESQGERWWRDEHRRHLVISIDWSCKLSKITRKRNSLLTTSKMKTK